LRQAGSNPGGALIAECADRITEMLVKIGEANVLQLSERMGERSLIAYRALGWLAFQGRIRYERRGNQVFVSLGGNPGLTDANLRPVGGR
jgi:hypothetical protein